jgi:hypothetical protein
MKNKLIILLAGVCLLTACKKSLLEPVPQTQLIPDNAFSTPERVEQQVRGIYAGVKSGQFFGGRYFVYNDVRGEEFLNNTSNGVTALQTWNFTLNENTNEVTNFWNSAYAAINRANVVLKGLENSPIDAALVTKYKGEAMFLRALSHYALLTLYGRPSWDAANDKYGVVLRLNPETNTDAQANLAPRAKVSEVYAQIISDLNFAEANLASTNGSNYANATRAHKNSAIALKTRVYLSMRQYDKVITEANKIVPLTAPFQAPTGVGNKLEANIATVFPALSAPAVQGTYTGPEAIFTMPFTSLDLPGTQNGLGSYYNPSPNGLGDYYLNPAGIVANAGWKVTDARKAFNVTTSGKSYLRKWPNNGGSIPDYAPVIRYSEVLLNLAEALVRQNNVVDARAVDLLNAVRQRSDPTTVFTVAGFATPQALIDQILTERRIEFLGEGLRSIDVMRLGQTFLAKDIAPAVAPGGTQYIWPIPLRERQTNTVIEQNPGY